MELTPEDLKTIDYALSDGVARQTAIIDQLRQRPDLRSALGPTIKEREELLCAYGRLQPVVQAAIKAGNKVCENCGHLCADRFCCAACREKYYRALEASAALPIVRDRQPSPPRAC